ncbi:hypothetical protein E1B28_004472 [Marasmius oreades]|uniref:Arginyl-tRNA--protein transferase 1 n=1 Tax=Marasmius oreades TaxID=181124 RepID=A0A9P7UYL2_9AGAR|nr:uncharacterized protein E1B28_004472 [Marasmius oreades]KAG7097086.1 hypothetical protein E1B28_004472 [Marasmius oreades]
MVLSIGVPCGRSSSLCGYCSPPGERSIKRSSRHIAGLDALQLSCDVYQAMIDRGWRRSGTWCYKPNLKASCCPQYPIRLDASSFKPSRSQRKLINRWNRFVEHGKNTDKPAKNKGKGSTIFDFVDAIHGSEGVMDGWEHRFEITLEESSYTIEKYTLFEKYQKKIHHDDSTIPGFKRFLVDSPLLPDPIPYFANPAKHLPTHYGSYHQLYRLDGKLIAMAVLDILPHCISSVYFMYDDDWEGFSLGKLSAIREISLARELFGAGAPGLKFLYLGYYIHTCQKMRYKGDYQPSFLCDPESHTWYPFEECATLLDANGYACFSNPENSGPSPRDAEIEEFDRHIPFKLDHDLWKQLLVVDRISGSRLFAKTLDETSLSEEEEEELSCCVEGLGTSLARRIIFRL